MRRFVTWLFWLVVAFAIATRIVVWWTEAWWFDEIRHRDVYFKILSTRLLTFALGFFLAGGLLWLNSDLVRSATRPARKRPVESFPPLDIIEQLEGRGNLERNLETGRTRRPSGEREESDEAELDRYRRWVFVGFIIMLSLLAGIWASSQWMLWHNFANAVVVGTRDPVFGVDTGFYLFRLPALRFGWIFLFFIGWAALGITIFLCGRGEALQIHEGHTHLSPPALRHLSALGAMLLLWKSLGYRLNAYDLLFQRNGFVFGAGYTDVHWRLPLLAFMSCAALVCAFLLWWWGWHGKPRRAARVTLGYFVLALLSGTVVPSVVQRVKVVPNEDQLEAPYIATHIQWTQRAYGLDHVREMDNSSSSIRDPRSRQDSSSARLAQAAEGLPVWPPNALLAVFNQRQSTNARYQFAAADIDRYQIGAETRPVMVAAREMPPASVNETSWINRRLRWISGYGLVMCDANRVAAGGQPLYYLSEASSRPANGARLRVTRPEIFFGEFRSYQDEASLMGNRFRPGLMPPGAAPAVPGESLQQAVSPAADYVVLNPQIDDMAQQVASQATPPAGTPLSANAPLSTGAPPAPGYHDYSGEGGVEVGSTWRKWLLAWRFGDAQLALTPLVGPRSRVVWHRRVLERCRQIAPFLNFETDPYPVLTNDGRIVWMLDVYSVSDSYPYSQPVNGRGGINYVRGAVKATVDAYNGTVQFYIADATDPLIRAYGRIFPGLFQPLEDMPEDLRRHARYPASLLNAQARIWARYHVDTPGALRAGLDTWIPATVPASDRWVAAQDLGEDSALQSPAYALLPALSSSLPLPSPLSQNPERARGWSKTPNDVLATADGLLSLYTTMLFSPESRSQDFRTPTSTTVTAGLLADGNYSWSRAQIAPQQRLVQWRPRAGDGTPSPVQVQGRIKSAPALHENFRFWEQQQWSVLVSAPAAAPVDGTLLYAQGILAEPGDPSMARQPRLQKVVLVRGDRRGAGDSVPAALRSLLADKTPRAPQQSVAQEQPKTERLRIRKPPIPTTKAQVKTRPTPPEAILVQARTQLAVMQRARQNNDWAAYGEAERKLGELLDGQP